VGNQCEILLLALAESDARIDDDSFAFHSASLSHVNAATKTVNDFPKDVGDGR
jgi:hypothetical protein